MKGIYLIAIVLLTSWTVSAASKLSIFFEADNECPVIDTCPPKLIHHESNCSRFYICNGGVKQIQDCAPGLYFSLRWRGCVKLEISDCQTPLPPPPPSTSTTPSPSRECEKDGQLLPHECNCTVYYQCVSGLKARRECPPGEGFNKYRRICEVGGCEATTTQEPTTLPTTTSTNSRICEEGTLSPHECQCDKYYECINGQKALRECGKGRHFDKEKLTCVDGEHCGICKDKDRKKHECNCNQFYECQGDVWYVRTCEKNEQYDESEKKCINLGACEREGSITSHQCDPRLWYECKGKIKKLHECEWGQHFNGTQCIPLCKLESMENYEL
ncbi:protein obstructor-E-like [Pogonomyrmex barbatus]|uniref:Protein obstructor-E-like n=1 Tax=Pogonomyrmex barbatus TaxID=144034 RepID=A0A6I9W409_9HYME|nr:protein obstructor-E-like [Pogonomyrmex barbatus]